MTRKYLIAVLGLTAALSLTACGSKNTENEKNTKETLSNTEADLQTEEGTDDTENEDADSMSLAADDTEDEDADDLTLAKDDAADEDADDLLLDEDDTVDEDADDLALAADDTEDEDADDLTLAKDDTVDEDADDLALDADDMEDEDMDGDASAELEPVTPSDYLVKNVSDYVTLGDMDGIEVTKYVYEITDDMINDSISYELDMCSEEVDVERASKDGDTVYLDLTASIQGSDKEPSVESTYFSIGYEEYGAEFDKQLTGVKTGDHLSFSITFSDDIWMEEWIGQTVDFTADITGVSEIITPEYDETFVQEYTDYDTMEEYEESIREQLAIEYEDISYSDVIDTLFETAIANSEFSSYPQELYDSCKEELLSFYGAFIGTTEEADIYEAFGITEDDIKADIEYSVYRRLLVTAICEENDIELTQDDYFSYLEENAAYYDYENAADFETDYTRLTLIWSLYESKAADILYASANISEETYSEDLMDDTFLDEDIDVEETDAQTDFEMESETELETE